MVPMLQWNGSAFLPSQGKECYTDDDANGGAPVEDTRYCGKGKRVSGTLTKLVYPISNRTPIEMLYRAQGTVVSSRHGRRNQTTKLFESTP
jgi:hypothetical protein